MDRCSRIRVTLITKVVHRLGQDITLINGGSGRRGGGGLAIQECRLNHILVSTHIIERYAHQFDIPISAISILAFRISCLH